MKPLSEVAQNKYFIIKEINGGKGLIKKLESLGIRKDVLLKKVSSITQKGPVVIEFVSTKAQVAIGYGMAKKIFVLEKEK
jgi:Fe2+ transport system protein FeoA